MSLVREARGKYTPRVLLVVELQGRGRGVGPQTTYIFRAAQERWHILE